MLTLFNNIYILEKIFMGTYSKFVILFFMGNCSFEIFCAEKPNSLSIQNNSMTTYAQVFKIRREDMERYETFFRECVMDQIMRQNCNKIIKEFSECIDLLERVTLINAEQHQQLENYSPENYSAHERKLDLLLTLNDEISSENGQLRLQLIEKQAQLINKQEELLKVQKHLNEKQQNQIFANGCLNVPSTTKDNSGVTKIYPIRNQKDLRHVMGKISEGGDRTSVESLTNSSED